jgi:hypothetical protein
MDVFMRFSALALSHFTPGLAHKSWHSAALPKKNHSTDFGDYRQW